MPLSELRDPSAARGTGVGRRERLLAKGANVLTLICASAGLMFAVGCDHRQPSGNRRPSTVPAFGASPIVAEIIEPTLVQGVFACTFRLRASTPLKIAPEEVAFCNAGRFVFDRSGETYTLERRPGVLADVGQSSRLVDLLPGGMPADVLLRVPIGDGAFDFAFWCGGRQHAWRPLKTLPAGAYKVAAQLVVPYYVEQTVEKDKELTTHWADLAVVSSLTVP